MLNLFQDDMLTVCEHANEMSLCDEVDCDILSTSSVDSSRHSAVDVGVNETSRDQSFSQLLTAGTAGNGKFQVLYF